MTNQGVRYEGWYRNDPCVLILFEAVYWRAALLPEEYWLKDSIADTVHNVVEEGVVGQCEQHGSGRILRSKAAEYALTMSCLRVTLGVAVVKAQCISIIGRLGPELSQPGGRGGRLLL